MMGAEAGENGRGLGGLTEMLKEPVRWVLGRRLAYAPEAQFALAWHGRKDYGGWNVCPDGLGPASVVYSVGVGDEIGFDLSLSATYGCSVHAFDSTPRALEWIESQALPENFHFHDTGIMDYDGEATFYPIETRKSVSHSIIRRKEADEAIEDCAVAAPVRRLSTMMRELGHDRIDVLKLDIEGAEYAVIADLLKEGLEVGQLLVEFHHRFRNIGPRATKRCIRDLREAGYAIAFVSPDAREFTFVKA